MTSTDSMPANSVADFNPRRPGVALGTFGSVTLTVGDAVAEVHMDDDAGRNHIEDSMSEGMRQAFAAAVDDPRTRVILLRGLPDVFCSGHARDWLLGAQQDAAQREDFAPAVDFIRTAIDCPLPVVCAMEGTAVGGGLLLGLYADLAILSESAVYATIFMTYGFTPGLGSTALLPLRLGPTLAGEMLYTGRGYTGHELRDRAAPVTVVAHDAVLPTARALARRTARAPRRSLEALKELLTGDLRAATAAALAAETPIQSETVALPQVQALIRDLYPDPASRPAR